jgi:hypothetical protein
VLLDSVLQRVLALEVRPQPNVAIAVMLHSHPLSWFPRACTASPGSRAPALTIREATSVQKRVLLPPCPCGLVWLASSDAPHLAAVP